MTRWCLPLTFCSAAVWLGILHGTDLLYFAAMSCKVVRSKNVLLLGLRDWIPLMTRIECNATPTRITLYRVIDPLTSINGSSGISIPCSLEQSLIDNTVDQWPTHLHACVRARRSSGADNTSRRKLCFVSVDMMSNISVWSVTSSLWMSVLTNVSPLSLSTMCEPSNSISYWRHFVNIKHLKSFGYHCYVTSVT